MSVSHRSTWLLLVLVIAPALAMAASLLAIQLVAFQVHLDLPTSEAFGRIRADLAGINHDTGPLAFALIFIGYVMNFGIIAVLAVVGMKWFDRRRASCFYIVGVVVLLGIAGMRSWNVWTPRMQFAWTWSFTPGFSEETVWLDYWVGYPPYALPLALLCALAIASLPLFREGSLHRMKRGVCPKCSYDLRNETKDGGPECGWNRSGPHAGKEQWRIVQRSAAWRKRAWFIGGWSVIVLFVVVANLAQLRSIMPHVTRHTLNMILIDPGSKAYAAIEIELDVSVVSRWFEYPGAVIQAQWSGTFMEEDPLYHTSRQQWIEQSIQQGQIVLPPPQYAPIVGASFEADSLAERAAYQFGDDLDVDTLDADTLANWMHWLFPDADPKRLHREAQVIIAAVDTELERAKDAMTSRLMAVPDGAGAFRGAGGDVDSLPQNRRLWYPGVAIVAGVVLAIWLKGAWVTLRWTKPKG